MTSAAFRILGVSVLGMMLANCATPAKKIQPTYISPVTYESYTCEQLGQEAERLSVRASEVIGVQNKKAKGDAVAMGIGLIVAWPALLFIKGDGGQTEAQVARLKGEMEAVEKVSNSKDCGLVFQQPETVDPKVIKQDSSQNNENHG